jgi:YggT family protein
MIPLNLQVLARYLVVAALAYAVIVAATAWAVRRRYIGPFGVWPRFVRRISDPVLRPLERRIVRLGGNPQDASLWLIGIVVVGGLIIVSLTQWLVGLWYTVIALGQSGPHAALRFAVSGIFSLLMIALFIRVISSWFGVSPYSRWMRPVMAATSWLVDPIRRILPPVGMIDFSPMVAWLVLWLARGVVMGML